MNDVDNSQRLKDLVIACNLALFEHYGVSLAHAENADPESIWEENLELAGLIGFTSEEVRGSLVIAAGQKTLDGFGEASGHRDWIQELANQLLGRVKNRLLPYAVDLSMTTPLSMRGLHLTLEPKQEESRPLLFHTSSGGAVCVLMDVEFRPDFTLVLDESAENAVPDEGELLLF
ncbi:MAG: hypothetical protein AAFU79_19720 [Myxococcota bacterium]